MHVEPWEDEEENLGKRPPRAVWPLQRPRALWEEEAFASRLLENKFRFSCCRLNVQHTLYLYKTFCNYQKKNHAQQSIKIYFRLIILNIGLYMVSVFYLYNTYQVLNLTNWYLSWYWVVEKSKFIFMITPDME